MAHTYSSRSKSLLRIAATPAYAIAIHLFITDFPIRYVMAIATVLRAMFGYLFLIFIARIVGRRPGKQLTPFEFVLIFFLGGLTLTGIVGEEVSLTNSICQIITLALTHYVLTLARSKSSHIARFLDGTPLTLIEKGQWRAQTMSRMRIQDDDVMAMARDQGMKTLDEIGVATLERNGEISIIKVAE